MSNTSIIRQDAQANRRVWNCRLHPTDWWHEVGCPHMEWTPEQVENAELTRKLSQQLCKWWTECISALEAELSQARAEIEKLQGEAQ